VAHTRLFYDLHSLLAEIEWHPKLHYLQIVLKLKQYKDPKIQGTSIWNGEDPHENSKSIIEHSYYLPYEHTELFL